MQGAGWSPLPLGDPLPAAGVQRTLAASWSGSRVRTHPLCVGAGCGKLIRPEKRVICLALEKSDESQEGSEAPGHPLSPSSLAPPRTCVGLGDAGAGPRSRPCRLDLLRLGYWVLDLGLGLAGWQGKREKAVSKGVPTPLGTREGTRDTPT